MPPKKKLKKGELPEVPEAQQILKGMVFYFIPNNDINPARKNRIKKAEQYGAVRALAFDEDVTHVICDSDMTYQGLLKHFKVEDVPETAVYVNENYPAECIGFRTIVDTSCSRFRVDGDERGKKPSESKTHNEKNETDKLLQPPKQSISPLSPFEMYNRNEIPESPTPSAPTCGPGIGVAHASSRTAEKTWNPATNPYEDELDKVMQEVKAIGDLVSKQSRSRAFLFHY